MFAAHADIQGSGDGGCDGQVRLQSLLATSGIRLRLRRGQTLHDGQSDQSVTYFVCDGSLFLQSSLPERRNVIVATYYSGDLYAPSTRGAVPGEALLSAEATTVIRLKAEAFAALVAADAAVAKHYERSLHVRAARVEAHAIVVGRLTGEERLAAYLIEAGCMHGTLRDNTVQLVLPFSRDEVADYLALNPDSLSRYLTRMKAEGLVTFLGHRRAVVSDWDQLLRRCPVADLLLAVFRR